MKNKKLVQYYILLAVLALMIILLIILFNIITYGKPSSESVGLPSLGLWKPLEDFSKQINTSTNGSLIEKNREIESPSALEAFKETFRQYWISYVVLFLIVLLLIAWVLVVFKVYNG